MHCVTITVKEAPTPTPPTEEFDITPFLIIGGAAIIGLGIYAATR